MPLFFFISGYLYRQNDKSTDFIRKRARHLVVPYVSFLLLHAVPAYLIYIVSFLQHDPDTSSWFFSWLVGRPEQSAISFTARLVYGGAALGGSLGIFWFPSSLFLTQVLYNEIQKRTRGRKVIVLVVMIFMYSLAMLHCHFRRNVNAIISWGLPWCIGVVALAIVYYYIGHLAVQYDSAKTSCKPILRKAIKPAISLLIVLIAVVLHSKGKFNPPMGMKFAKYGIPIISFVLTVGCISIVHEISKMISIAKQLKPLKVFLIECGKASMVIMFLHSVIQWAMAEYAATSSTFLRTIVSLGVPYCLYRLFRLSAGARKMFLGDFRPVAS